LDADPSRRRALDFGCGVGRLTFALANEFERVDGVDISAPMIEKAAEYEARFSPGLPGETHFHLNTNLDLSLFDGEQFSFVLSLVVLQHLQPEFSRTYITEFCRLLEPGGTLVFQIPARRETAALRIRGTIGRSLRRLKHRIRPDETPVMEMFGTPPGEVEALIDSNGLRLIAAVPDNRAETWESYTYVATRD
ncbi:MAG: class I SAM-dependent methyltransferase, partial [Actinomycetota bacterium]|nr:class I SAM-dependent methyltransferase [Actinomycetota bacterium]